MCSCAPPEARLGTAACLCNPAFPSATLGTWLVPAGSKLERGLLPQGFLSRSPYLLQPRAQAHVASTVEGCPPEMTRIFPLGRSASLITQRRATNFPSWSRGMAPEIPFFPNGWSDSNSCWESTSFMVQQHELTMLLLLVSPPRRFHK